MTEPHAAVPLREVTAEEERAVAASVETALVLLLNECPYYAHIAHALRLRVTRAVPTAAVSLDMRLFINPDYWEGIGKWRTRAAVLAHEVSHVLHSHIERCGKRFRPLWYIASDLEINDNLATDGWPLIEGAIRAEAFSFPAYRTADWYYDALLEKTGGGSGAAAVYDAGNGAGEGGTMSGGCLSEEADDGKGPSWADKEAIRDQTAREAESFEKTSGTVPGHLLRWAAERLRPRVDWRLLLRRNLRSVRTAVMGGGADYTFRRPSRRNMGALRGRGPYLPASVSPTMRTAVIVDTSASVSPGELARAVAEAGGICASVSDETHVYACDAEAVYLGAVRTAGEMAALGLPGGGGTDMGEGLALAAEKNPDAAVALTDGYTPWPETPPGFPVIVALLAEEGAAAPPVPGWAVRVDVKV